MLSDTIRARLYAARVRERELLAARDGRGQPEDDGPQCRECDEIYWPKRCPVCRLKPIQNRPRA